MRIIGCDLHARPASVGDVGYRDGRGSEYDSEARRRRRARVLGSLLPRALEQFQPESSVYHRKLCLHIVALHANANTSIEGLPGEDSNL
jgi:hypothetical protein